ncbi:MAG: hypothetical protein PHQ43_01120 [Dehalococcoidales bacterium]|nr:hypothetical protein [Dehalococcoidales bacterium]
MGRLTRYIVYVDKGVMNDPNAVFDATMGRLIGKKFPLEKRKVLLAKFIKLNGNPKAQLALINQYVLVRDASTFPFEEKNRERVDASAKAAGGVSVDDGADGEQDSGDAPEPGDQVDEGGDEGGDSTEP